MLQAVAALDAIGARLGVLSAMLLQDETEAARAMVVDSFDDLRRNLRGASETSAALKEFLCSGSETTDWSAALTLTAGWIVETEGGPVGPRTILVRLGRLLLRTLGAPRAMWRKGRLAAARRSRADFARRIRATMDPEAGTSQGIRSPGGDVEAAQ